MASMFEQPRNGTLFNGWPEDLHIRAAPECGLARQVDDIGVKSPFAPSGLDYMTLYDVTVTNDAHHSQRSSTSSTLCRQDSVDLDGNNKISLLGDEYPSVVLIADVAEQRTHEVGDPTTSVILIDTDLLPRGEELIKYRINENYLNENVSIKVDLHVQQSLIGADSDFFADMVVDAMQAVSTNNRNETKYPVKAVNILKDGKSTLESVNLVKGYGNCTVASAMVHGYAKNCCFGHEALPKRNQHAKLGVQIMNLQNDPQQLADPSP
ncbi:hypothetical protein CEK25_004148 [Fusarium fujikuroi]|nr:hypothetical protein CEK25_004148 [Fusarium fujikuroi]